MTPFEPLPWQREFLERALSSERLYVQLPRRNNGRWMSQAALACELYRGAVAIVVKTEDGGRVECVCTSGLLLLFHYSEPEELLAGAERMVETMRRLAA